MNVNGCEFYGWNKITTDFVITLVTWNDFVILILKYTRLDMVIQYRSGHLLEQTIVSFTPCYYDIFCF